MDLTTHFSFPIPDDPNGLFLQLRSALVDIDSTLFGIAPPGSVALADPGANGLVIRTSLGVTGVIGNGTGWLHNNGSGAYAYSIPTKTDIGLANVTNDAQVKRTEMGAVNGVATLDSGGLIPNSQLPPLAITDTFVVASQAAMLALTAQVGDVAVRSDLNKSFILRLAGPSTLSNWQELLTPTDAVLSVFGRTGAVVTATNDYTWAQINKTVSSIADITTRSASDISSGTLTDARLSSNVPLLNAANIFRTQQEVNPASSNTTPLVLTSVINGANIQPSLNIFTTWNTSGSPTLIFGNVVNTTSGSLARLLDLQVDGVSKFTVSKSGWLGIGTNAPILELEIRHDQNAVTGIVVGNSSAGSNAATFLELDGGSDFLIAVYGLNHATKAGIAEIRSDDGFDELRIGYGFGFTNFLNPVTITGILSTGSTPITLTDVAGRILSSALNIVQPAQGGTGLASYAVGDLLYASGSATLSKLADVATGNALISGGVTTAPNWGKVGLTTHVSGILPSANGGTSIAYFQAAGPTTLRVYTFPDSAATIARTDTGQTFAGTNNFGHVLPSATDTYDLGSTTKLWRKGWLSELDAVLFAQNTTSVIGGWLIISKNEGLIPVGQDVGASDTSIDFGQAMTLNDFVLFRAAGQVEYAQVGTLSSGTRYNVTRNLDGSGANTWIAGTVYMVLGNTTNGRIELNSNSTPRVSVMRQGSTYNAQTEMLRIGDLNGSWNVSAETYGFAVGQYGVAGKSSLRIDDSGIHFYNNITERIQFLADGSGYVANSAVAWDAAGSFTITGNAAIAGWSIAATTITSTGVTIKSGANAAIAFGATPPTSALVGTGVYLDSTGLFGLKTSKQTLAFTASDGTVKIGSDLSAPASTSFVLAGTAITYNGESLAAGALLLGDNSANQANVLQSGGSIKLRRGTTDYITLTSTDAQFLNLIKMTGASAAISIGATPPTSASAGTGLWIDRTGIYGLNSSVLYLKWDANGGGMAAGNGVTINLNGITSGAGGITSAIAPATTSTDGIILTSEFGAHSIDYSPRIRFRAQALNGAVQSVIDFWMEVIPVSFTLGPDLTSAWVLSALPNGVPGNQLLSVDANGKMTVAGVIAAGSGPTTLTDGAGKVLSAALNTVAVAQGGTGTATAFTTGAVVFAGASGVYSQSNADFFWDNSNKRLGIGIAAPVRSLHVVVDGTAYGLRVGNAGSTNRLDIQVGGVQTVLENVQSGSAKFIFRHQGVDSFYIDNTGIVNFGDGGTLLPFRALVNSGGIGFRVGDSTDTNYMQFVSGGAESRLEFTNNRPLKFKVNNIESLKVDGAGVLSVYDGATLQPVTFGAANSAGAGFRAMKVPN